jgi:predicted ArsR family transcriptional regulator
MDAPTTVDDLAAAVGRHPNTTREHLEALRTAGLVAREALPPHGRGRPAYRYRAVPPGDDPAGLYVGLASVLAEELARSSGDPAAAAVHAGRSWSRSLATDTDGAGGRASSGQAGRERVVADLATLGFAPQANAQATVVRLRACPMIESARRHPHIVCAVHQGLVEGLAQRYGCEGQRVSLTPFADPGWCRLGLPPGP